MWILAAWVPFALIAVVSAFQVATNALLVTQMGVSSLGSQLLSTLPWWVVWLAISAVLLGVVALVSWLLRGRPRIGFAVSALLCALILAAVWVVFVAGPLNAVLKG